MENKDRQAALFMAADEICDYLNINNSHIFSHFADRRDNDVCITLYNKELIAKEIEIKFTQKDCDQYNTVVANVWSNFKSEHKIVDAFGFVVYKGIINIIVQKTVEKLAEIIGEDNVDNIVKFPIDCELKMLKDNNDDLMANDLSSKLPYMKK